MFGSNCSGLYPSLGMFSYALIVNYVIHVCICCDFFCYKGHFKFCSQGIRVEISKALKSLEYIETFQLLPAVDVSLCHCADNVT